MLYFLQVLSHIEQFITPSTQTQTQTQTIQSSQTSRSSSQQSTQPTHSCKDDVCGMQDVLLQNIAEHFANACKASDSKLLAVLFSRSAALLRTLASHSHHTHFVTITGSLFAYLKEAMGLSVGGSSSQVSSPMKKPKAKHTSSQESDVFDLVDETDEGSNATGTSQADLGVLAIHALKHVAPCVHKGDSENGCAIATVEEKLCKILESTDITSAVINIRRNNARGRQSNTQSRTVAAESF
jgi:hypothetical protein